MEGEKIAPQRNWIYLRGTSKLQASASELKVLCFQSKEKLWPSSAVVWRRVVSFGSHYLGFGYSLLTVTKKCGGEETH